MTNILSKEQIKHLIVKYEGAEKWTYGDFMRVFVSHEELRERAEFPPHKCARCLKRRGNLNG